jgi:hypothetical protein
MKTTPKHFQVFKKECLRLIDLFELNNWNVEFQHGELNLRFAEIKTSLDDYIATIGFNIEWDDVLRPCTEEEIKKSALHEVIHLLLSRLSDMGAARYITSAEFKSTEEELVHKLEKIMKV